MYKTPLLVACVALTLFTSLARSQSTFNAYHDFYLSPTANGWTGATNPSTTGASWGYYAANVNGLTFPTQIGTYFTLEGSGSGSQSLYRYSSNSPLGNTGTLVGVSGWADTGGTGFPYYQDNQGWISSLGRYGTPWFAGAPGLAQGLTNLIWMQPSWLAGQGAEGIAPVLTWTAPQTAVYVFSGLFVAGDQPDNGASVAVVDNRGGAAPLSRTVLAPNTTVPIAFTNSYTAGDVVQFQVGSDFKTGNAVGLQIRVTSAISTNVILSLQKSTNLSGPWQFMPVTAGMITPAGELNVGALTNTNAFYRLKIRTAVE